MDSLPSVENDIFSNDSMTSIFTNISLISRLSSLVLLLNLTHYVFTAD